MGSEKILSNTVGQSHTEENIMLDIGCMLESVGAYE